MTDTVESRENIFWDRMTERAAETVAALRAGRRPPVIRFAVHVTARCNMRCRYCREDKVGQTMARDKFVEICHRAGQRGIVHITGGEPLLVPWLEDVVWELRGVTRFALNTNLFKMPNERTLQTVFRVKTSLDDCDAERWNETTGGRHFDRVVEHIRRVSDAIQYCSVSYTATHQSAANFAAFVRFVRESFPNLFSIGVSFYKGEDTALQLTQDDIAVLFGAAEGLNDVSRQVFYDTHTERGNYFPENLTIPCYLSLSELLIDEHGHEYHCSHLYRDKVTPPGRPGKDPHCVTGCNARFSTFNKQVHEQLGLAGHGTNRRHDG